MNPALSGEPQVAITRALLRRHEDAFLIPQSIRIDLALLDLKTEYAYLPPRVCDRINLGPVFELSRRTANTLVEKNGILPAAGSVSPTGLVRNRD